MEENMNSGKLLMLIAAGKYQLPAIMKAKEMGLRVLATDFDPDAPGFSSSDFYEIIDVKDKEANLKLAKQLSIDGVMSICCEPAVRTVSYIAERLGLPGLSYEAAIAASDKGIMREKWLEAGLPSPRFFIVDTQEEAVCVIPKLMLPAVVKPVDNAGSRGVTRIEKVEDLDFSFSLAKESSRSGRIIIEEFIRGTEMTVEALSYNKHHHILGMSSKRHYPLPYRVASGQVYPSGFPKEDELKVRELIFNMLDALNIDIGPSHSEVMMTEEGPIPVELAARGCGFGGFSDIVPFISGVDIVKECINMAMGYDVEISPRYSGAADLRFLRLPQGKLIGIRGLEEARKIKGVCVIELNVSPGDTIKPITCDASRHGQIIAFGDTREEALRRAEQAEYAIEFEIAEK